MFNLKKFQITILILLFAMFSLIGCSDNVENDNSDDLSVAFLNYIINPNTYNGYDSDQWLENFIYKIETEYNCKTGTIAFLSNRQPLDYYNAIEQNKIISVKINIVELIENVDKSEQSITNKYKISYIYIDENNKEFNLTDVFLITVQDNMIINVKKQPETMTPEYNGILSILK